jgi:hypothetical protein
MLLPHVLTLEAIRRDQPSPARFDVPQQQRRDDAGERASPHARPLSDLP